MTKPAKWKVKYFAWCYLEGQGKSKKLMTILPEFNAELFLFMDSSLVYFVTMHSVQINISSFPCSPFHHVKTKIMLKIFQNFAVTILNNNPFQKDRQDSSLSIHKPVFMLVSDNSSTL